MSNPIEYEPWAMAYLESNLLRVSGGSPFRWTGTHYEPVIDIKTDLRRWFKGNRIRQTNAIVENTLAIVLAMASIKHTMPCWDDGRQEKIIPFRNGLYRMATDELVDHTSNYLSTWVMPCDYDPDALCPRWLRFVGECLNGDDQQIRLLQEWFGYCLSGDTSHQKYMSHIGAPGCGKSTIASIIGRIMGSGATAFNVRQLAGRFGKGSLIGKSLAICGEVELAGCRERSEIMETLKTIVGNDKVQIERKGDNVYPSVVLPTRFHVLSNATPDLKDPTLALCRRMLVLRSDKTASDPDTTLETKLVGELAGVAQWALEGYRRLREQGRFTAPDRQKAEMVAIQREASPAIAFLSEHCRVWQGINPGSIPDLETVPERTWAAKEYVWEAARKWAEASIVEINPTWFFKDLYRVLPGATGGRRRDASGNLFQTVENVSLKN